MKCVNLKNERISQTRENNHGSLMEIVKYENRNDITVKFLEHGNLVHTNWNHFLSGGVKNVYDKSMYGVGYIGEGSYKLKQEGKLTPQYASWIQMITRCYDGRHTTYNDCEICDAWCNFQNFAQWYDENYYEVDEEQMNLDKDILVKGNKIYSPETSIFTPKKINVIFVKSNSVRGNLPVGVHWSNRDKKYVVQCSKGTNNKSKFIGHFDNPVEAFQAYKTFKENYIKNIAEEYKSKIPYRLYESLINYIVEITD